MMNRRTLLLSPFALAGLSAVPSFGEEPRKKIDVDTTVDKGLEWLKRNQAADGHWDANGGQYPTTMTALAGMAFLMEGSTLKEGKYSDQLVKAVNWFLLRQQGNGLLGNPNNNTEAQRYMYGHGFGMLFLSCSIGEEEDKDRRKKLEKVLAKAAQFSTDAQTDKGGWGYVSAKDGSNFDEGSTTITQVQGLRAARNAGVPVKKQTIDKSVDYLTKCTTPKGGIIYSLANGAAVAGQERPPLTAAAIACAIGSGELTRAIEIMNPAQGEAPKGAARPPVVRWIEYCKENIPFAKGRVAHDEYQSYYYSQAMYMLGDDRYSMLFPGTNKANAITWSAYREAMYDYLKTQQNPDGSWTSGYIGTVFSSAVNLCILQLEKGILPIYHR